MPIREVRFPGAAGRDDAPPDQRKVARRFKTFWPTEIRTTTEHHRLHVLNLADRRETPCTASNKP